MDFFAYDKGYAISKTGTNVVSGLSEKKVRDNSLKFGTNEITKKKEPSFISRLASAITEPMMLILIFGFIITLGVNIGKKLKTGDGDFSECFGIIVAVILSVSITMIMEGSSKKAFVALKKMYSAAPVKVIRNGTTVLIPQTALTVGDILILEAGDKVNADCRLIEADLLTVDESALTGESNPVEKDANAVLIATTPLAERKNCVYSGTFVVGGSGKAVVTAIGDNTEIGRIAGEISGEKNTETPLQTKLNKLGKIITLIGLVSAVIVFAFSIIRLATNGNLNFNNVQELFISCIVLIVAAVPEGLPTIVAISLALNMIKLAKENALIKKMSATETAGAVSVICSDKTGTLTQNKMAVDYVCSNQTCNTADKGFSDSLMQNFILNSTAEISGGKEVGGNGTEHALLRVSEQYKKIDYKAYRAQYVIKNRVPFSSDNKYMTTDFVFENKTRRLIKGAPEKVLFMCEMSDVKRNKIFRDMEARERMAKRVICFAHADFTRENEDIKYVYDGFVSLSDPVRKEVFKAVSDCKRAGIKVKILTGDNKITAFAIAKELKIARDESTVVNASDIENLDEESFKKAIEKVTVIARSTPIVKLRVVKALKCMGEVVAVTGDGINDAPAIRHADIGIAMGRSGSEITKEVADAVLLDDSFATVVKAVSFGRNVYRNLQRFIIFQLSVNLSALLFVTVSAIMGLSSPFNTLQLLWINVIMDGPPALTLGLEPPSDALMNLKPVKKSAGIVSFKMLIRILFNGVFIGVILILQYTCNFLNVSYSERASATFTLFILFQLFNAFNCRELGSESILKRLNKNKIMLLTFLGVFVVHIFIISVAYGVFGISPLSVTSLLKCLITASSIVFVSELYKLIFRLSKGKSVKN